MKAKEIIKIKRLLIKVNSVKCNIKKRRYLKEIKNIKKKDNNTAYDNIYGHNKWKKLFNDVTLPI